MTQISEKETMSGFMTQFWRLIKSAWTPENTETYWDQLFSNVVALVARYPSPFCKGQVLAFWEYLETKNQG